MEIKSIIIIKESTAKQEEQTLFRITNWINRKYNENNAPKETIIINVCLKPLCSVYKVIAFIINRTVNAINPK
jgi:hypothetical protein